MMQLPESKFMKVLVILFIIHGTFGFMCFILEEAMQTAMFGSFAFSEAKDWDGLRNHIRLMESVHSVSAFLIYSCGWLAPVTFPAYVVYLKSNRGYIDSAKSRLAKR